MKKKQQWGTFWDWLVPKKTNRGDTPPPPTRLAQCLRFLYRLFARPSSRIYQVFARYRAQGRFQYEVSCPALTVGNLKVGGSGKTPFLLKLAQMLPNKRIAIVARSYRTQWKGAAQFLPFGDTIDAAPHIGDEPRLFCQALAQCHGGVWTHRSLGPAIDAAAASHPDILLIDDGLQNRRCPFGQQILSLAPYELMLPQPLLPLGRWKETLDDIAPWLTGILLYPSPTRFSSTHLSTFPASLRSSIVRMEASFQGWWHPQEHAFIPDASIEAVGVCAIAEPERFWELVEPHVVQWHGQHCYLDHAPVPYTLLANLWQSAHARGATAMVMTEKDYVRWFAATPPDWPVVVARTELVVTYGKEVLQSWVNQLLQ